MVSADLPAIRSERFTSHKPTSRELFSARQFRRNYLDDAKELAAGVAYSRIGFESDQFGASSQ
jgi:hypothetical protein